MGLKRLILSAWLSGLVLLLAVSPDAQRAFETFGSNYLSSLKLNRQVSPAPVPVFSGTVVVDLVAQNLSGPLYGKVILARYEHYIDKVASGHGVSPALVKAVIHAESDFNPWAVSPKGAVGLMQILPDTADMVGVDDLFDPNSNIKAGVKYLKALLRMFNGDETLAAAAYNTGPGKVKKYKGVPPYKETRTYIERVLKYYRSYLKS